MSSTEFVKIFILRSLLKQKQDAALLSVQGGAFDIEPTKTGIQSRYGNVFAGLGKAVLTYSSSEKWNASPANQVLAFSNLKYSNLIATNTYKATSNLFSLRDSLISAYLTIFIMGVTIAFELGGFSDMRGVSAVVVAVSQTPITQFAALEDYFALIKKLFDAVSVRDTVLAGKLGDEIKTKAQLTFSSLIPAIIEYYVGASKSQGGDGVCKQDVGVFLGTLVSIYKPVTDGNIDAIVQLASQPIPGAK